VRDFHIRRRRLAVADEYTDVVEALRATGLSLKDAESGAALVARFDPTPSAEDLAEQGRRLASRRDDLVAQGIDPAGLEVPLHPGEEADRG
jgi:hypothetical protein